MFENAQHIQKKPRAPEIHYQQHRRDHCATDRRDRHDRRLVMAYLAKNGQAASKEDVNLALAQFEKDLKAQMAPDILIKLVTDFERSLSKSQSMAKSAEEMGLKVKTYENVDSRGQESMRLFSMA